MSLPRCARCHHYTGSPDGIRVVDAAGAELCVRCGFGSMTATGWAGDQDVRRNVGAAIVAAGQADTREAGQSKSPRAVQLVRRVEAMTDRNAETVARWQADAARVRRDKEEMPDSVRAQLARIEDRLAGRGPTGDQRAHIIERPR